MRELLRWQRANLAEMTRIGVPVPPGLKVTTQACNSYLEAGGFPPEMWEQELAALKELERGQRVRSSVTRGIRFLYLVPVGGEVFYARDDGYRAQYRPERRGGCRIDRAHPRRPLRLRRIPAVWCTLFGSVVMGVPDGPFEELLAKYRAEKGIGNDADLAPTDLHAITGEFKEIIRQHAGARIPH